MGLYEPRKLLQNITNSPQIEEAAVVYMTRD
jgi:hypothetical protein